MVKGALRLLVLEGSGVVLQRRDFGRMCVSEARDVRFVRYSQAGKLCLQRRDGLVLRCDCRLQFVDLPAPCGCRYRCRRSRCVKLSKFSIHSLLCLP